MPERDVQDLTGDQLLANAPAILKHLQKNPDDHSIPSIAAALKIDEAEVQRTLDEVLVGDGVITYEGPGCGGGWIA